MRKLKLKKTELSLYVIGGLAMLASLVMFVLDIVAFSVSADNSLRMAEKETMDFLYIGLILIGIGAVIVVITLLAHSYTTDKEHDKAQRRAQRLAYTQKDEKEVISEGENMKETENKKVVKKPKSEVPESIKEVLHPTDKVEDEGRNPDVVEGEIMEEIFDANKQDQ